MFTFEKTSNGLGICNQTTKKAICGHSYPTIEGALLQCRKEVKDLFSSKEPITFEFLNKIMNQSNTTHIQLPFKPRDLRYFINSKDPVVISVKNAVENDRLFLEDFLRACNEYIYLNRVSFHKLVMKEFDFLKDGIGPDHNEIRYLGFSQYPKIIPYNFAEGYALLTACQQSPIIKDVYVERLIEFFDRLNTTKIDILKHMGKSTDLRLLIEDLSSQRKHILVDIGFDFLGEDDAHANAALMDCTDDEIFITVIDPHLYSKGKHKTLIDKNDKINVTQSDMMEELEGFIEIITEKKVTIKRKCIQDSCGILSALQTQDKFKDGVCATYSIFIISMYLINRKNESIKAHHHDDDDDITCFFALLGKDASILVAIFFLVFFLNYKDVRNGIWKELFQITLLSDNAMATEKRLHPLNFLKCRLNCEPDPGEPEEPEDEDEDEDMEL